MKIATSLALAFAVLAAAAPAAADEKQACVAASAQGQRLQGAHKLLEAREQLRVCAAAGCPSVVQTDCATWLAEVEKALPGVVISAKSGAGADLADVKVTIDGAPLLMKLDGTSVAVDPGPHLFHFLAADGTALDQQVIVREGEKDQRIVIVLGAMPTPPSPRRTVAPPPVDTPPPAPSSSNGWKTAGWVLGAAGIAGFGVGTIFGVLTFTDKSSAHCSNSVCDPGTLSGIKSAARTSDIAWIAGGVLFATGATLILWGPKTNNETAATLKLAPMVSASGGGVVAGGAW